MRCMHPHLFAIFAVSLAETVFLQPVVHVFFMKALLVPVDRNRQSLAKLGTHEPEQVQCANNTQ
jgi:hypothetical protein